MDLFRVQRHEVTPDKDLQAVCVGIAQIPSICRGVSYTAVLHTLPAAVSPTP